ncbi:MAG: acyl-CoA dehydrogenase family protein [SAR202 cluster bacterium]|jgi:alkylation response protein AidB-like acyl-CoA dehydrogenase|nr:acyl-CoA dehydrogenase family protein [SAR202 cluster bacterium]MDP6301510.1 acyl-CoA dehydrogenase family protein [SAR202 cluster bacterium]MDP7104973.1 acyl-CoA dehydrogenase family protein [SAR202 cluster bacterium]MDP7226561.1 acyl-CoA dehydrogenase family protein [SAR202 cluster bacterium]MDP7414779.1 acyl-CoA dehydrogenase family protein [SAR202 cluster bacterium]|tara:strand:+ start:8350 stop:9519 length:1170 start_codon:yes stop_codon:yes gene_type:complete
MDVLLSEEQRMLQTSARDFLGVECPSTLVRDMEEDANGYPPELWRKIVDLGWVGLALPEDCGGQGLPLTYQAIVLEEVGRALAPLPLHSTVVPALAIAMDGTAEQRRDWLPPVAGGNVIMTWATNELDPQLRPETIHAEAVAEGDDFVINGVKQFVDNFNVADRCLVVCRTAEASADSEGLSIFLVDTDSRGISQTPLVTIAKDKQSHVQFENVRVPKANLLGDLNGGWPIAERMLDRATVLLCAQMVGAARKDSDMAIEYSKGRVAFGRPIASFQSIQHLCADMAMWVDGCQLLTYEALWRLDEGAPAGVEVSQAKAFCNEKCEATVRSCQQIHGGIGFMMEFDVHLFFRRVSAWTMRLGTTYEHRSRIANALLESPGKVRLGFSVST